MPILVLDPPPADMEALLERRRRLGQDRYDEVWEGVLHMAPAPLRRHAQLLMQIGRLIGPAADAAGLDLLDPFNLGEEDDFRIPDGGLLRPGPDALYLPTAALVIEVLSPGDETFAKLPFYAAHDVDEVLIADPDEHTIQWLGLTEGEYEAIARSRVVDLGPDELAARVSWPSA